MDTSSYMEVSVEWLTDVQEYLARYGDWDPEAAHFAAELKILLERHKQRTVYKTA